MNLAVHQAAGPLALWRCDLSRACDEMARPARSLEVARGRLLRGIHRWYEDVGNAPQRGDADDYSDGPN